jgi:hypothetical protein
MSKEPSEIDIEKLLAGLRSSEASIRKEAAQEIANKVIDNPQLVKELERLSTSDPDQYIQETAAQTLKKLGFEDKKPGYVDLPPERTLSRNEKIRDFAIGFFGWYIINGLLWIIINPGIINGGTAVNGGSGCITFPLNLIVLIVFARIKQTHWIAFGILVALALNLVVSLIIGVAFNGWCFIPFYVK